MPPSPRRRSRRDEARSAEQSLPFGRFELHCILSFRWSLPLGFFLFLVSPWWLAFASSRRLVTNPVRPGREQR